MYAGVSCFLNSRMSKIEKHMGHSIQEWTKQNLWKRAFKKFEVI